MLRVMRAMLAAIGTGRIDTYESPVKALEAMSETPPDLALVASAMQPLTGPALVRSMRYVGSGPLCFVPAMVMSANAEPLIVESALRAGVHQVLVLPTSANALYRRLDWLLNDDRPFELKGEHYLVLASRIVSPSACSVRATCRPHLTRSLRPSRRTRN
jgi:two-component system chemotaxis response regulator CheY